MVVDSCMMPRELLDRAKAMASENRHPRGQDADFGNAHSFGPGGDGGAGSPSRSRLCCAVARSNCCSHHRSRRAPGPPVRVGWAAIDDDRHTFCRRWISARTKSSTTRSATERSEPTCTRISGPRRHCPFRTGSPDDTASVQTLEGKPITAMANYSMHYYGASPISADLLRQPPASADCKIKQQQQSPPFVVRSCP